MTNASHNQRQVGGRFSGEGYQQGSLAVEANPYLLGVNKAQAAQIWKRLTIDEKTSV